MLRQISLLLLFSWILGAGSHSFLNGQETQPEATPPVAAEPTQPPAEPVTQPPAPPAPAAETPTDSATPADSAPAEVPTAETAPKETTIYIPYDKLRDVFEKQGRGVFLPYEKFQELWKAARSQSLPPAIDGPPMDAIISEAENIATVQKEVVQVQARLTIDLLKKGWNLVPLRLDSAAIQSATIADAPARIIPNPTGGYALLVENDQETAKTIELNIVYARAFSKAPGQNSVSFNAPQAPVNRWTIRIPEAGVKVNVHPLIAATEQLPNTENADANKDNNQPGAATGETVLLAFVGAAPEVRIDWNPRSEGATGLSALANVQVEQQQILREGVLRTRAQLVYSISRAEISQFSIEVPNDQKVVNVFDPNVRKWDVEKTESTQKIVVQLFEPAKNSQSIAVELEKLIDDVPQQEINIPTIKALEVGRQQGIVVGSIDSAFRSEVNRRAAVSQVDRSELPADLANQNWSFAYRYSAIPFDLSVNIEKIKPRISVDHLAEVYIEPNQLVLDLQAIYDIEQAGVFQLELELPAGFELRSVRGRELAGVTAASVDSHQVSGENNSKLTINLSRKAIGKTGIAISLYQRLDDPNLITPTGDISTLKIPIARAKQEFLERSSGRIILYAPESLRVNPTNDSTLRAISVGEALTNMQSLREGRFATSREILALAFSDQPFELSTNIERRKPFVTAKQLVVASIDSGVVRYESTIFFDIRYSGVKELRVDLPAELASEIRNQNSALRESVIDPLPEKLPQGYTSWKFIGESELLGQQVVKLSWERKTDELEIGKSLSLSVPKLIPANVDRAWGQVVITKTEALDVLPDGKLTGLRPIDPQHDLMSGADVKDAARAFEFHDDNWALPLLATRYQLEEVKRTSIERSFVKVIVTRSEQLGVQAMYRIRSARQRLAIKLPDGAEFDSQPLRINGQPIALERGENGEFYIPLVGQDPSTPFVLDLRYNTSTPQTAAISDPKSDATNRIKPAPYGVIDYPVFPEDAAIQKMYVGVFLPTNQTLLGSAGPWTEEFTWQGNDSIKRVPLANRTTQELEQWVSEGISLSPSPSFQVDGTLYLFSTLRPNAPPEGSLRLTSLNSTTFATLLFLAVAGIGCLLLIFPWNIKLISLGVFAVLLVLSGFFAPTLAEQLLNAPLVGAVALVAILWGIQGAIVNLPTMLSKLPLVSGKHQSLAVEAPSTANDEGDTKNV